MDDDLFELKNFLEKIDLRQYPDIVNYLELGYYVRGVESFKDGPVVHDTLYVKIFFDDFGFQIRFDSKDVLLGLMVLYVRIMDDFLEDWTVQIGGATFCKGVSFEDIVQAGINSRFDGFFRVFLNKSDSLYSKDFLTYVISPKHNSNYYLLKELERWGN